MRKRLFTEAQIIGILKEAEAVCSFTPIQTNSPSQD